MKKGRFSEAQIVAILQQQASGQTVAQIVREHGLRGYRINQALCSEVRFLASRRSIK